MTRLARLLPLTLVPALALGLLGPVATATAATDPISDERIAAAVAQLDGIANDYLTRSGVPGLAIAVVHDDQVLYSRGFGVRDVDTGAPVTPETVFQLASVSKSVGASVVAAAVGRGIVNWQDPVIAHLADFALSDPYVTRHATIADMYAMRSGLPGQVGDVLESIGYDRTQIIERMADVPLAPFRMQHLYTNFGLTVGAEAVAVAAGKPWEQLSQDLIYGPLGMTSTSSTHAGFVSRANRTALHVPIQGRWVSRYVRNADAQSPAGGVSSNVVDLSRWMRMELDHGMLDGRQVVASRALAKAQTAQIRTTPVGDGATVPRWYGSGMGVTVDGTGRVRLTHSGAFSAGGGTTYLMLPSERVGIVVLANALSGVPEAVAASFADLVETGTVSQDYLSVYGPVFAQFYAPNPEFAPDARPARPLAARNLADYAGTYRNDFLGAVVVSDVDGRLRLRMGPKGVIVPMRHWTGDHFVGTFGAGDYPGDIAVDFTGTGDRVSSVTLGLGEGSPYTLARVG